MEASHLALAGFTTIEHLEAVLKGEWDEAKHPREPAGSEHGGEFATLYHGTSDAAWKYIQQEGLEAGLFEGGDAWAKRNGIEMRLAHDRSRKNSVFMTPDPSRASAYAYYAQEMQGGEAIVLEIRVPGSERHRFIVDEHEPTAVRFEGRVPPEWIRFAGSADDDEFHKAEDGSTTVYVVLLSRPIVEKMNPNHEPAGSPKGGQFARATGSTVDSPEFRAWFGNSAVVDKNGNPLVVYKAMYPYDWTKETADSPGPVIESIGRTSEFPAFNHGEPGIQIAGFFGDIDTANGFAERGGNQQAIYPVYLSLQHPYIVDAKGGLAGTIQFGASGWAFREAMRSERYDGAIIRNTADEGTIYVAVRPNQIKSAIANRGTWDPNDPDIAKADWDPAKHPREPKGASTGGQFTSTAFHGSAEIARRGEFEGFRLDISPTGRQRKPEDSADTMGIWWTDDQTAADAFGAYHESDGRHEGALVTADLAFKKPLVFQSEEAFGNWMDGYRERIPESRGGGSSAPRGDKMREYLVNRGYDGVIIENAGAEVGRPHARYFVQLHARSANIRDVRIPAQKAGLAKAGLTVHAPDVGFSVEAIEAVLKAEWRDDLHPRQPAGAPKSSGGEFAPKDSALIAEGEKRMADSKRGGGLGSNSDFLATLAYPLRRTDEGMDEIRAVVGASDFASAQRAIDSQAQWQTGWAVALDEWFAANAMGGNGSVPKATKEEVAYRNGAANYYGKPYAQLTAEEMRAFGARRAWMQEQFRKRYGDEITVYRGVSGRYAKKIVGAMGDDIDLPSYSLSSWSVNISEATNFAKRGGRVLETNVRAEDVWLLPRAGVEGVLKYVDARDEIVVLNPGKTRPVRIVR